MWKNCPQAYDCCTSFCHLLGLGSKDLESFLLPEPTRRLAGVWGASRRCSRTSPRLAPLMMGHPTGPPDPAWPGACHHCVPDDTRTWKDVAALPPIHMPWPPRASQRRRGPFSPQVGLGFRTYSDGASNQWMPAVLLFFGGVNTLLCDHSQVRNARRGKCSQWPDTPSTCRTRCQPNWAVSHTQGRLRVLTSDT